ncbi:MAG: asparagine synthase (glutamine-hydrolyzing) [Opitutae bacterium]|nr:asparagine synthase (glutamine-hydrolyzing) [Opitutae bacterium]|tara:strand:+ start:35747 stop:37537 length:1791 start_codon:yes stop_codon:yes gene_type:complete
MCGIAGVYNKAANVDEAQLSRMLDIAVHRGPDDQGTYLASNGHFGIGMNRLSIIDLSSGNQPIWNEDRSLIMVCNGEIYNYKALRQELEEQGHVFSTNSDVEVALHLFEEDGPEGFGKLDGMFALAIYSEEKEELTVARDRHGIKPLYFSANESDPFYFGSEPKSILTVNQDKTVREDVVLEYLVWGYSRNGKSIWADLEVLPKGSFLRVSNQGHTVNAYYKEEKQEDFPDFESAIKAIREGMIEAVKSQLMSEVPLGVFLSGGIDSTIIVGIVSKILGKELKTFSMDFDGARYSELDKINYVSNQFHTEHHTFKANKDIFDLHEDVIRACDEPFGDPAALPTFYLSAETVKHVTVALSGDGADEFQYGYGHHRLPKTKFGFLKNALFHKLLKTIPSLTTRQYSLLSLTAPKQEWPSNLYFLLKSQIFKSGSVLEHPNYTSLEDYERQSYLENDILLKTDRMSMYHSLEARVPFLANDLVDLAKRVPKKFQVRKGSGKSVLKAAFPDLLDDEIINQKKHGFTTPVGDWIKQSYTEAQFRELIFQSGFRVLLNEKRIKGIIRQHFTEKYDHGKFLYRMLTTAKWDARYQPQYHRQAL